MVFADDEALSSAEQPRTGQLVARFWVPESEEQLTWARQHLGERLWRNIWGKLGETIKDGRSYQIQVGPLVAGEPRELGRLVCEVPFRRLATVLLTQAEDAQVGEHVVPTGVRVEPPSGVVPPFPRPGILYPVEGRLYRFLGWSWQRVR